MRHCRTTRAFTLIEGLFALFVVTVSGLALVATLPIATSSRKKADYSAKAVSLAQKEIENMRYIGYANLTDGQLRALGYVDSSSPGDGSYTFTNVDVGAGDSPATVLPSGSATLNIAEASRDLRSVSVTIRWRERNGVNRSITVDTLIANL